MENDHKWYLVGKQMGKDDKLKGEHRKLRKYPSEFVRGYLEMNPQESWYDKMNDKVTDMLARMGSSRLK